MGKGKTTRIGRDAKSGKFIPVKEAKQKKSAAVVETIRQPKKQK